MVTDEGNFRAWKLFFFHRNREKITGMRRTAAPEARSVTAASSLRRGHAGTPPLLCSVPQCWMKTIVLVPSSSSGTTPHPPHQPTSSNKIVERRQESIGKREGNGISKGPQDGNRTRVTVSTTALYVGTLTTRPSAPTKITVCKIMFVLLSLLIPLLREFKGLVHSKMKVLS
ncbi:uncharacterized protein LOC131540336 isoform X3 [Onychostoma macrolepis]|uniref:uncharacterized protein LOC131540336 isoform X3 n=1 Tax=Onychostoma macrolepis TaxID=369639 RepID=UPI0027296FB8|nr:uncharacterized protein LOC131540336 isoform X3 [Onychostoma macrolepis]